MVRGHSWPWELAYRTVGWWGGTFAPGAAWGRPSTMILSVGANPDRMTRKFPWRSPSCTGLGTTVSFGPTVMTIWLDWSRGAAGGGARSAANGGPHRKGTRAK